MAVEIYVFHPGAGVNRPSDGPLRAQVDTSNVAYIHQLYPEGFDKQSFFQGVVLPPKLDITTNITAKVTFRQETAGSGNVRLDLAYRAFPPPAVRDAALTNVGAVVLAVPGTLGQEFTQTFSIPTGSMVPDQELFLSVLRLGSHVTDTYVGDLALLRLELNITLNDIEVFDEATSLTKKLDSIKFVGPNVTASNLGGAVTVTVTGSSGGGHLVADVKAQINGSVNTFNVPNFQPGTVFVFRNGVQEKPSTVTEIGINQVQLSVIPAITEEVYVWYVPP